MCRHPYVTVQDVVERILRRKRNWYHGKPLVTLIGDNESFGKLQFNFGDEVVEFSIYIKEKDEILDVAHLAIENFSDISDRLAGEYSNMW